jgi:hypothetical protein
MLVFTVGVVVKVYIDPVVAVKSVPLNCNTPLLYRLNALML